MRRPNVKLDNLISFITVADKNNIDDAADELGLSASGVRKQLDAIENALGIRLFEKIGGRLVLTEDGEFFYKDAAKAVEQARLAEEQVYARQAIRNRHLLVGHSTNLPPGLMAAITQLRIEADHLVQIEHRSGLTSTTVRGVLDASLHAGFGILPIRAPELLIRLIYEEPLVACMPTGHRLATKHAISPHDLDGEPFIAVSREPWPERHREVEEHLGDFGVVLSVVADAYLATEALAYVEQKAGVCLLPNSSVAGRPGIITKPLSTHVLMRRCGIFIREDNRSPLLQRLVELSLRLADNTRWKRGPVSVALPAINREDSRKAEGAS
ncbi:MAG TPA: LysR family transcriptional regulator [Terracidiphilus sp.]|nr:LysR family transcriptional regulator [Terracidiphilus sp.]HEV2398026.1 LysR family transcriptional regulator [Candidatus Sulfotelmatobacter sp.]